MNTQNNQNFLSVLKIIFIVLLLLLGFNFSKAQAPVTQLDVQISEIVQDNNGINQDSNQSVQNLPESGKVVVQKAEIEQTGASKTLARAITEKTISESLIGDIKTEIRDKVTSQLIEKRFNDDDSGKESEEKEKFHWKPALIQSGVFLGIQHGFRLTQKKTRRELGGPFFRDWARSVKGLRGWDDSDNFFTNYIAHPLQGGLTGRIFVNNSDRAKKQEFGNSKKYWESRFKAMVWSAVWSTQFELGPISEASIGNVGIREKNGRPTMAWQDLIVTPTVGTGVLIGEDAIDKYVLKNWVEKKISSKLVIKIFRIMLTPTTSVSNLLRLKLPSHREYRPL